MRIFVIVVLAFLLGALSFYFYSQASKPKLETVQPTITQVKITAPIIKSSPTPKLTTGIIKGTLSYPSEMIPSLIVVAFNTENLSEFYYVNTEINENKFEIEVPAGKYYLVSYTQEEVADYGGGYSKAVDCGLSVECEDHDLIPITINKGETKTGIELTDWYAPTGTFPNKPDVQE